ncbi:hypothetical protein ZIOFF_067524 [Zingiber officinale]|uniref:Uncharacterized protein n=1 Tax=Zingiber officinale TaxID=94328 RepID=A0A8J5C6J1_ZINOF|nr:hypothetical protein ZIOFF_067524 [Zingiber officinale]
MSLRGPSQGWPTSCATPCSRPSCNRLVVKEIYFLAAKVAAKRWRRMAINCSFFALQILSWVQNKFQERQEKKRLDAVVKSAHLPHCSLPVDPKEEFKDWPQSLLAIGTFGDTEIKEESHSGHHFQCIEASQDLSDFGVEEFNQLKKELKKLLSLKSKCKSKSSSSSNGSEIMEEGGGNMPLNRFLNFPSRLGVDKALSTSLERLASDNNGDISPSSKMILISKVKDMLLENPKALKKKSVSFIIKKMFVCSSGFAPAPSLRDPIPESRMEKMLRAILTKKIHQQSSAPIASKKCIENKSTEETQAGEEGDDKGKDKCKWVKTDSDCDYCSRDLGTQ